MANTVVSYQGTDGTPEAGKSVNGAAKVAMYDADGNAIGGNLVPLGCEASGSISTAAGLPSPPAGALYCTIQARGAAIYLNDFGAAASGAIRDLMLLDGETFFYTGDLSAVSLYSATGQACVHYYGVPSA